MNTIDSILEAENKEPISPHVWLEGASKLLALVGNEQNTLYELESVLAKYRADLMSNPEVTASKAKILTEARGEYLESRKLKAKIERVFEVIRLGKVWARMSDQEFKLN